jgi:DNA-binding IclR family transcriptional regulator
MESKLDGLDPNTYSFKILCYLTFKDVSMKPIEIAKALDLNGSTVRARLAELKKEKLVENTSSGYKALTTTYDILMKLYRGLHQEFKS